MKFFLGKQKIIILTGLLFVILTCFQAIAKNLDKQGSADNIWNLPKINSKEGGRNLSNIETLYVRGFRLRGNTIFPEQELFKLTKPYTNREITFDELDRLRRELIRYYIKKGYINSGVIIPDQRVDKGVVTLIVIEGRLSEIKILNSTWLASGYITSRMKSADTEKPFNIKELQTDLKLLKENPLIENINASVSPGLKAGEATVNMEIQEARPYTFLLKLNNYGSPSVGAYRAEAGFAYNNITGWGDSFKASYNLTEGLDNFILNYTIPFTSKDTSLSLKYSKSTATIVAEPFDMLDIESRTTTYGGEIRHPFYKTISNEFIVGLRFEKHHNETSLAGIPFSFTSHTEDSETDVTVVSLYKQWVSRSTNYVFAVNSDLCFGVDLMGATVHEGDYADGRYVSWLGQTQIFTRIPFLDSSLLVKSNLLISDSPLLSVGKFSIGGAATVRGYRENLMTPDNGFTGSIEWQVPLFHLKIPGISKKKNDGKIELCPFFDYGKGWNKKGVDPSPDTIYSAGAGLKWGLGSYIRTQVYYGKGLVDVDIFGDRDLQDEGVHFQVEMRF